MKKYLQIISIFSCLLIFTACGQNSTSNSITASENPIAAESSESQQEQEKEKTDSETKTDSTEKYKDIKEVLLALENDEYDKAIELIEAMKSEPETEVVKINLDN